MTLPTDLPVLAFPDQAALEAWLESEHATAPGLYVQLAKKGAGVPSVTYAELVESCLCFGWIVMSPISHYLSHALLVVTVPSACYRVIAIWICCTLIAFLLAR